MNLLIWLGVVVFLIYGTLQAFEPINETRLIKQNVGGELICNSVFNADHHSWVYDIDYFYKVPQSDTLKIGSGSYYGRPWEQNEQLIEYCNWFMLKTGDFWDSDKIIIGKKDLSHWRSISFSPETIEKDSLWISKNIFSKRALSPHQSLINKIENGIITVDYLYRIDEDIDNTETQVVTYRFDEISGTIKMISITKKDN